MIISLRLSALDYELVRRSAAGQGLSVSAFIREAVLNRIEVDYLEMMKKEEVMLEEEME